MAKVIKKLIGYEGGREETLSGLGTFFLWISIIGSISAFVFSGFATRQDWRDSWADNGFASGWVTLGIVCLIQGIAANILCKAFADVVRLLKKQVNVPYGGELVTATPIYRFTCSECNTYIPQWADGTLAAEKCAKCGFTFGTDPIDEKETESG